MSIRRYAGYNLLAAIVPMAVSLVTVPLYLKVVGLERYGVLSICWVLVGYFGLFELGLGPATAQRIAAIAARPASERNETIWAALYLSLALGSFGACLLFSFARPMLRAVHSVGGNLTAELNGAALWLSLLVPLSTSYGVLWGALQGSHRFKSMNLIGATGNILIGVAPLATAMFVAPRLAYLLATVFACRVLVVLGLLVECWRAVPMSKPGIPPAALLRSLAAFGGWVTASATLVPLLTSADKLAIGWLSGAAAVSIYMVPFNLVTRLLVIPQSLASALFPRFAVVAEADVDGTEYRALRSLSAILTPILLCALLALKPFLAWWIGPAIAQQTWPIGTILIGGIWFNCCSYVPHSRLQGRGRPDLVTKLSLAQVVPYLLCLYFAVKMIGAQGAALVWSARVALEMFFFIILTGQPGRLISALWQPGLLLSGGVLVALLAPFPNLTGVICLLALLIVAALSAASRLRDELGFKHLTWRAAGQG